MSQENVEAIRARYQQYARGDFSEIAVVTDDFELVASPENPDTGTYRGAAGVRWMTGWVESFEGLTIEATEIVDAGEKVLVAILQRGRPRGSQTMVEGRWWQVVTLREGVLARLQTFQRREQALEAAGLSE